MSTQLDSRLRPDWVFVIGEFVGSLTSGMYLATYGLFLILTPELSTWANLILSFKFLFEFILELLSAWIADLTRIGRRPVLLTGCLAQAVAFILLAGISAFGLTAVSAVGLAVLLVLADLLRSVGNAFISGVFDAWAVTSMRSIDASFDKTAMFASARVADRSGIVCGAFLACTLLWLGGTGVASARIPTGIWAGLWLTASLGQFVLTGFLWRQVPPTGRIPMAHGATGAALAHAIRASLVRPAMLALTMLGAFYSTSMLITFAWPTLLGLASPEAARREGVYLFTPVLLALVSLLGATAAKRAIVRRPQVPMSGAEDPRLRRGASTSLVWLSVLFCAIGLLALRMQSESPSLAAVALGMLLVTRFVHYFGSPYVDSMVHDYIGEDESLRAAVVSFRTAAVNLVAFGVFFLIQVLVQATDKTQATGIACIGVGGTLLAGFLVAAVRRNRRKIVAGPASSEAI